MSGEFSSEPEGRNFSTEELATVKLLDTIPMGYLYCGEGWKEGVGLVKVYEAPGLPSVCKVDN